MSNAFTISEENNASSVKRATHPRGELLANGLTLLMLGVWWGYAQFVPAYLLPAPDAVFLRAVEFVSTPGELLQLFISLGHVAASIAFSFIFGCVLAASSSAFPVVRILVTSRLTPFLNAFAAIGWLFIGILWFGLNSTTVVFTITLVLLPFTIVNVQAGIGELDHELIEMGRSLYRGKGRLLMKIVLPLLTPYLFAALRTSFGVAWKVVLTAELFGGNAGVGYLLNVARQEFDTESIFAIIALIFAFVLASEVLFFRPIQLRLQRRLRRD
jgi:NitT/TauT family transport system permease protein